MLRRAGRGTSRPSPPAVLPSTELLAPPASDLRALATLESQELTARGLMAGGADGLVNLDPGPLGTKERIRHEPTQNVIRSRHRSTKGPIVTILQGWRDAERGQQSGRWSGKWSAGWS